MLFAGKVMSHQCWGLSSDCPGRFYFSFYRTVLFPYQLPKHCLSKIIIFNSQEQTKLGIPYHSMFLSANYCQGQNIEVSDIRRTFTLEKSIIYVVKLMYKLSIISQCDKTTPSVYIECPGY